MVMVEIQTDQKTRKAVRAQLREKYGSQPPPQQRPHLSLCQGYAQPIGNVVARHAATGVFSPHLLVFQLEAMRGPYRRLDLLSTLDLITRWREAILSHSNGLATPVRCMLSGHNVDGSPADQAHLAFLPLASVGHDHADGHLLGIGLALPAHLARDGHREALREADRWERVNHWAICPGMLGHAEREGSLQRGSLDGL